MTEPETMEPSAAAPNAEPEAEPNAEDLDSADRAASEGDEEDLSEEEYRNTVSQLLRVNAPESFKHDVEETIRQRSGGRFFGRKAFGQRVPYEILALLILAIGIAAYMVIRSSTTGSLRYEKNTEAPHMAPGAKDVVPQPKPLEKK